MGDLFDAVTIKLLALVVIYLFLPLSALTYYSFRRHRHLTKVERILRVLAVDERDRASYDTADSGLHLLLAVTYSSIVSVVGLAALMFNERVETSLGMVAAKAGDAALSFPVDDSLLMLGMAFLGAYLWGIQYVFRRYMSDDLSPGVFYGLSMRMLLAGALAVVIFNAYEALAGGGGGESSRGVGRTMWPALAFVLGMFPQRGLNWLREKIPMFSPDKDPSVRMLPLEMIEGISLHDRLRLEECGIDSCHNLATTDFVPLSISTPYSARTLIDWMLQAKLCIYCGDAMRDLRGYGIRTIADLEEMTPEQMDLLAQETSVTRPALEQAKLYLKRSPEVARLRKIGSLLGVFAMAVRDDGSSVAESGDNIWHAASDDAAGGVRNKPRPPTAGGTAGRVKP